MNMLTVALPIYKMSQIAWLAFEGLARQIDCPDYELIICEEVQESMCTESLVAKYADDLFVNGCKKISILQPQKWISLPAKWRLMGRKADELSIGYLLLAADCYPHPLRLRQTFESLSSGVEWYQESEGYFFDLSIKKLIKYEHSTIEPLGWKTGLNMAFATKFARNIPKTHINRGVDHFLYNEFRKQGLRNVKTENPKAIGLDTNSANCISHFRIRHFHKPSPPFIEVSEGITDIDLPTDIIKQLKSFNLEPVTMNNMKKYLFIKSRNVYKKGEVRELPEVIAELYLKEGIVENLNENSEVKEKVYEPKKSEKVLNPTKTEKDVPKKNYKRRAKRN